MKTKMTRSQIRELQAVLDRLEDVLQTRPLNDRVRPRFPEDRALMAICEVRDAINAALCADKPGTKVSVPPLAIRRRALRLAERIRRRRLLLLRRSYAGCCAGDWAAVAMEDAVSVGTDKDTETPLAWVPADPNRPAKIAACGGDDGGRRWEETWWWVPGHGWVPTTC